MAHHHLCRGALLAAADSIISSAPHLSVRTAQHNSIPWLLPVSVPYLPAPNPPSRALGPLLHALLLRSRTLHTSPAPLEQHPPATHNPSHPSSKSQATSQAAHHSSHPVVPGTWFRVVAGSSRVTVEHVAGWSDVAELRGRPAGGLGTVWRVTPGTPPLQPDEGEGAASLAAQPYRGNMPNVRQEYDVHPDMLTSAGDGLGDGDGDSGYPVINQLDSEVTGATDGGLLHLTVPEKWISFDIHTTGGPVSVSRVVEADLRVASGSAAVTLGSVRGLQVRIDTTAVASGGGGEWSPGSSYCCDGGAVKGGEVSGTAVSVQAAGPITIRRVVGGNVRLAMVAAAVTSSPATAPTATVASAVNPEDLSVASAAAIHSVQQQQPHSLPAMDLGAVYGGRLSIRTAGNAVRIGTLDCGGAGQQQHHHQVPSASADAAAAAETSMSYIASSGGGDRDGDATAAVGTTPLSYDGAKIQTYGGAVCLDGVEGDAVVESGGGAIKVLAHARLRSLVLRSGGGPIDIALSYDSAPELLEVRNAVQLDIDPGLGPNLKICESSQLDSDLEPNYDTAKERTAISRVWRASVVPEPESGRSTGRGGSGQLNSGRGRVEVQADGGAVRLRRLSWMDALRSKMADRQGKK